MTITFNQLPLGDCYLVVDGDKHRAFANLDDLRQVYRPSMAWDAATGTAREKPGTPIQVRP